MSHQLDAWRGAFGDAYTDRNDVDWRSRFQAWRTMLADLEIQSILEVGSNKGANLRALREMNPSWLLLGLEPNAYARDIASTPTVDGDASCLPFPACSFDLVFTAGLLIHIPPDELDRVLGQLHRVARRYLLAIEYQAEKETAVTGYHGRDDMLWKRPFNQEYLSRFPDLRVIRFGHWGEAWGFDNCTWWLMEKSRQTRLKGS